ncbi:unnamed protein product [Thlaspi arvense]|uniref:Cytochrome P450 n=1 Tax=Thlaspi arvense TaxID=13288 RepID=A0AAU9S449_THLAR|nr:unnamed protein product [Thlaspi arvense]
MQTIVVLENINPAKRELLRKLSATQLFSPQRIEATRDLRVNKVKELVSFMSESSEREEAVDISRASFITALNIISNILFSVDLGNYDPKKFNGFQDTVISVMEAVGDPDVANYFPFMRFLDLQGNGKKMKAGCERLFKDLFTAGTDTSSSTLEWAMTELLGSPKTMAKAQMEIDRVIGQNGTVQESDISKLPYLQAVVKETFRVHPPAPLLVPRKAEADAEILGFKVPKDTQVLVNVWAIGRDPSVWANPTRFEPERFLGKEIDVKGRDYELTPFGGGRRICPGLPLAVKTVSLMLASLLYSFDWKIPNGIVSKDLDMDETFGLTLHKTNPLHAIPVKKRAIN